MKARVGILLALVLLNVSYINVRASENVVYLIQPTYSKEFDGTWNHLDFTVEADIGIGKLLSRSEAEIIKALTSKGLIVSKRDRFGIMNINGVEVTGRIVINEYVSSLTLDVSQLDIVKSVEELKLKGIENIRYEINGDIGCGESGSLGIIKNENEGQINEFRIKYAFDEQGKILTIQYNLFHGIDKA